jgi:cation diffusion facilitator family transporter
MADKNIKIRAGIISLVTGLAMFAIKMGAYILTGSAAIFSDAAESVVHILATAMALYSIILSSKPADKSHLYGHSNVEYFSAGIEGLLIIAAALYIIFEAANDIIYGSTLRRLDIGIIIILAAGIINLLLGYFLIRTGKETNSLTLVADGKHVLTDSYTSFGVIVGVTLVLLTGVVIFDPLFAIAVALNIMFTGYSLVRESVKGLMKETNTEVLDKIVDHLRKQRKDYWIDIHELRFWQSGDKLFLDFHLIMPYYFSIEQSHSEENEIEDSFKEIFPNSQIKIHFDYCKPELCKFCNYDECQFRSETKSITPEWNTAKLIGEPIYKFNYKQAANKKSRR